eukprot:gene4551-5669_t
MSNQPGQPNKTQAILQEVDKVKSVMHDNIGLMLNNHDKASNLQDKTASMNSNAQLFKKQTVKIRRQMWCRNMKDLAIVLTDYNKNECDKLRAMYWQCQNQGKGIFLQETDDDSQDAQKIRDKNQGHSNINSTANNNTFTIESNSLSSQELITLLTTLTQGGFLQVPCHLIWDSYSKEWKCESPSWFISKIYFTLGEFIASWFEKLIWTRYWENIKEPHKGYKPPLCTVLDTRKKQLKEFWSKLSRDERKRYAMVKIGNVLNSVIQSVKESPEIVEIDFMEKLDKLLNLLQSINNNSTTKTISKTDQTDNNNIQPEEKSNDNIQVTAPTTTTTTTTTPTTTTSTTTRSPSSSFSYSTATRDQIRNSTTTNIMNHNINNITSAFEDVLVQNPVRFVELLFFSPLEHAGTVIDMVKRQIGTHLQNIHSESVAMDLISSEERMKKKGGKSSSSSKDSSGGGGSQGGTPVKKKKKSGSSIRLSGSSCDSSSSELSDKKSIRKKRKKKTPSHRKPSNHIISSTAEDNNTGSNSDTETETIQTRPRRHSLPMDIAPSIKGTGVPIVSTTEDEDGEGVLSEGEIDYPPIMISKSNNTRSDRHYTAGVSPSSSSSSLNKRSIDLGQNSSQNNTVVKATTTTTTN